MARAPVSCSDARDVRHEATVALDARVPPGVALVDLVELVTALGEADRLRGVRRDTVAVPRDLPRDRDFDLRVDTGERHDRSLRLAEALRDAADRPPELAAVEEVG